MKKRDGHDWGGWESVSFQVIYLTKKKVREPSSTLTHRGLADQDFLAYFQVHQAGAYTVNACITRAGSRSMCVERLRVTGVMPSVTRRSLSPIESSLTNCEALKIYFEDNSK